jgi:hypothetical protein
VRHLLTFSGAKYHDTTERIVEDAPRFGVDRVWVTDDYWLRHYRPAYWDRVRWFREHPGVRGVDWFCFKPFVIADVFRRLPPGDTLLWLDADTYPMHDLSALYETCKRDGGVMLFNVLGCRNGWYTKRDALIVMGADSPEYLEPFQAVARFALFEKGAAFPAEKFLGEWLGFTANPFANTFDASVLGPPEHEGFIENRCEQSVLSCLAVRYGVRLYREACEFGNGGKEDWDLYPQLFHQCGSHSYRPGYTGDETEGSAFRNVLD